MKTNCPLQPKVNQFIKSTHSANKILIEIRDLFDHCKFCPYYIKCSLIKNFIIEINNAISDLTDTWNLKDRI